MDKKDLLKILDNLYPNVPMAILKLICELAIFHMQIVAGSWHSLALKVDGTLVSWGRDSYGQVSKTPGGVRFYCDCSG